MCDHLDEKDNELKIEDMDCAVCLQKCHYPTQLPCGHVFCFLCVKGVAIQNKKCAMCRAAIPSDYLDHPVLLEVLDPETISRNEDQFQWYYEGRNGWWRYDSRSNAELERAHSAGLEECAVLVAGALYRVHFPTMLQSRRVDPARRRRVHRDTPAFPAKGIAGIKLTLEDNRTKSDEPLADTPAQLDDLLHSISNLNINPNENTAASSSEVREEPSS